MRNIFFSLLVFISSTSAFSASNSCSLPTGFQQTVEGKRSFGETEFLSRNHSIGLYRGGSLTLSPWISIAEGDFATVGIDQKGNVVQVLNFIDKHGTRRQVAALLSHGKEFKSVFMTNEGQLYAFSKDGKLYAFSWEKWNTNQASEAIAKTNRRLKWSVCGLNGAMLVATAVQAAVSGDLQLQYLIGGAMGSIGLVMTHLTAMARNYEVANEETNGFIETNVFLTSPLKSTQYIWSDDQSGVRDFELTLEDGQKALLSDGLKQIKAEFQLPAPKNGIEAFDLTCDHLLLARGIPASQYEPDWNSKR